MSAGVKGGLAGSVAMAVLAILYGLIFYRSPWYPINLLAGAVYGQGTSFSTEVIAAFHLTPFVIASAIHLVTSLLVGLLYGVMLPMFPRRPILLGGIIAPLMWSGLLYATLELLNPVMNERIDWRWFVASQFAFGIVAGMVVARHTPVRTLQHMPFAVRAGFEAGGMGHERDGRRPTMTPFDVAQGAPSASRGARRWIALSAWAALALRAAALAGPAPPRVASSAAGGGQGLRRALPRQLFGLSWFRRQGRSRPRARESRVPRYHR